MTANDTRLVPITQKQRDSLIEDELGFYAATHEIAEAWDAAPADAAEAVRAWFDDQFSLDDDATIDEPIASLLAALGMPEASA